MRGRKILEINPESSIIADLRARVAAEPGSPAAKEMAELLYQTSLLTSGFQLESPADFASAVFKLMGGGNAAAAPAAPSGGAAPAATVEAEVVDDPWKK